MMNDICKYCEHGRLLHVKINGHWHCEAYKYKDDDCPCHFYQGSGD